MKRLRKKKLKKRLIPYCKCLNCGKKGPHFIPPSLGDKGFFLCEKKNKTATSGNLKGDKNVWMDNL